MKNNIQFYHTSLISSMNERCFRQKKIIKEIKTHILCSITILLFFSKNRAVCEKMWKNILEQSRTQMSIWRMRIACWISKTTNTNTQFV